MSSIRYLTAGESHGKALTTIVEGVPAGLYLTEEMIRRDLARRQRGYGRGGRMQIETDYAEIISGVRHGYTMGSPIALLIRNRDWDNWKDVLAAEPREGDAKRVTRLRPGHADLPGVIKYRTGDGRHVRGGGLGPACRPGLARAVGSQAGCPARRRDREHPIRQGRGNRPGVR